MTVQELISELMKHPFDHEVIVWTDTMCEVGIGSVEIDKGDEKRNLVTIFLEEDE